MSELTRLSARDLLLGYRDLTFTPSEVVEACARRIEAVDPVVGAFTALCLERAHQEAAAWTEAYARGDVSAPLAGVPVAAKDLFDSAGVRTTYGSPLFLDHVPDEDAEAIRRLRSAGAILLGKTQTHEFAWGISSVNELMGTSHNTWDRERICKKTPAPASRWSSAVRAWASGSCRRRCRLRLPTARCGSTWRISVRGRCSCWSPSTACTATASARTWR